MIRTRRQTNAAPQLLCKSSTADLPANFTALLHKQPRLGSSHAVPLFCVCASDGPSVTPFSMWCAVSMAASGGSVVHGTALTAEQADRAVARPDLIARAMCSRSIAFLSAQHSGLSTGALMAAEGRQNEQSQKLTDGPLQKPSGCSSGWLAARCSTSAVRSG
ncbi:hypothetical protein BDV95DRAFT_69344 [Massariosphaeria phaeospora]|uniref:Uncharacterized protein n=1 Tax=Massariosphaeria phaeospora TaxID=100035 RepID=A0A7C8I4T9_9PLEO|nr:hypothetical protein BDV95DRAFT_69344 [Massariosphaeria phaeospora]